MSAVRLYELLKEVFLLLDDGDRRIFDAFQLTESRYYALYHLGSKPGISSSRLSELMFCDKSNITRLIRGMEGDGLVVRAPHETDRRTLRLFLTPAGEALRQESRRAHEELTRERLSRCLSDADKEYLFATLMPLRDGLEAQLRPISS